MQTNIERERSHAFVLTPEDLRAIVTLLAEHYGKLSICASCSEGSKLSSIELAELVAYDNPNFRRIESIAIRGGEVFGEGCSVAIGTRVFSTCSLSISDHDDKRALKVADELGKRFDDCKPWYSFLTRIKLPFLLAGLLLAWPTFCVWRSVVKTGKISVSPFSIEAIYLSLPFVLISFFVFTYADRGWNWMFPKVWFSIGRQSKEFEMRAKVRNLIFGVILLGIFLSIIANLITFAITRS